MQEQLPQGPGPALRRPRGGSRTRVQDTGGTPAPAVERDGPATTDGAGRVEAFAGDGVRVAGERGAGRAASRAAEDMQTQATPRRRGT